MTDKCKQGYDYQESCQRYNIIGCHKGYSEELKDDNNKTGYTEDCKYLIKDSFLNRIIINIKKMNGEIFDNE